MLCFMQVVSGISCGGKGLEGLTFGRRAALRHPETGKCCKVMLLGLLTFAGWGAWRFVLTLQGTRYCHMPFP